MYVQNECLTPGHVIDRHMSIPNSNIQGGKLKRHLGCFIINHKPLKKKDTENLVGWSSRKYLHASVPISVVDLESKLENFQELSWLP